MGFIGGLVGKLLGIEQPKAPQVMAQPVAPPVSAPELALAEDPYTTKKPKTIGKASLTIPTGTSQGTTGLNI